MILVPNSLRLRLQRLVAMDDQRIGVLPGHVVGQRLRLLGLSKPTGSGSNDSSGAPGQKTPPLHGQHLSQVASPFPGWQHADPIVLEMTGRDD
ncbi:hypothetical protein SM0020_26326 [Sinorhizobium meliloti CCNWSX0020]|uniref:Uncharacterized protein n=1 Tax=Sinorhizobium meliloti CCNWSX0020 TaxID=1107881 RepID=H0G6Y7_RHIML|nr:hypothetical protein SM0020_26326 [Sinorhizobium meliloti CCNWSX0020]